MKKLITLLAGVILTSSMAGSVYAQAAGPTGGGVQTGAPGQKPGQGKQVRPPIGAKVLKELNLTPDQHKQVRDLVQKFVQKRQEEAKAADGQKATKQNRKAMAENRKVFLEDLGKILTAEQNTKLKQLMDERGKKGKKDKKGNTIPPASTTTAGGTAKTGGGL